MIIERHQIILVRSRIPSRIRIISKHNVKAQRTDQVALLERQRRIFGTQCSTDSHLANTRRYSTRRTVDNVAVAWLQDWRWVGRTGARSWLLVVCSNARLCTSVDGITGECEMSGSLKDEETGCLDERREIEDKVADLALGGVGVELEVEDCAFVFGGDGRPFSSWVCLVGVLRADGYQG